MFVLDPDALKKRDFTRARMTLNVTDGIQRRYPRECEAISVVIASEAKQSVYP
jgi:hypothetical protein